MSLAIPIHYLRRTQPRRAAKRTRMNRERGMRWEGEGEKVKGSKTFKIAESASVQIPIRIVENTEKIMDYRSYNWTFLNPDICR